MTILPTGDVYACRRMESKIGNVFSQSLYELYTGQELDAYRQYGNFEKCAKCELLRFCRGCPAVSYGYTGNMPSIRGPSTNESGSSPSKPANVSAR